MLKLLPDAADRLAKRMTKTASLADRLKAMQVVHELELESQMGSAVLELCADEHAKVRSKAVSLLIGVSHLAPDALIDRLLIDPDPRVRANAIEVLESRFHAQWVPILVERARHGTNRERGNAIKVLHRLKASAFASALAAMLRDTRPEHRVSGMWVLRQTNWWGLIGDVGKMARADPSVAVRRYALGVLQAAQAASKAAAGQGLAA